MKYEDIKNFLQRCEVHPDHQSGMITHQMLEDRLQEEIDELREYIEQRTWVGLTDEEISKLQHLIDWTAHWSYGTFARAIEAKLKEKNT
jgi:hypothetical protein